jgi:thiol:disulfide interchange protein DsbC
MKLIKLIGASAALCLLTQSVFAETAQEAAVKTRIQKHMGSHAKVDSVIKTPYSGLFEVKVDGDIFYTDAKARYMIVGHVIDTTNYRDYTGMRLEEMSQVRFDDLPLSAALKQVKGKGTRVMAVFEDPNCGYCKKFRGTLQDVDDVTIYTFMFNILAEDSAAISKNIWCSADPVRAWDDWLLHGKRAPEAPASCVSPNEKVLQLGKKLRVAGTPTVIFQDGGRIQGALDKAALEKKFASIK